MKVLVIGGTGLIGSKTVERLKGLGHNAVAGSPKTGIDSISGEGLDGAMAGADVVIDLANSPSWEDAAVMKFFKTSASNIAAAEKKAGVKHHIALSIVGTERLQENGYFQAKLAQEAIVRASGIPYTLVHSTQFFEFLKGIADAAVVDGVIRLSPAYVQPIAADDVARIITDVAIGDALNGMLEIAGPERVRLNQLVTSYFKAEGDTRPIVADPHARYFGAELADDSLVPLGKARLGSITLEEWRTTAGKSH